MSLSLSSPTHRLPSRCSIFSISAGVTTIGFLGINADTNTFVSITAYIIRQPFLLLPFLHGPTLFLR